ncbi:MEDS domain-containing protein [Pseudonocardia lacus]|uniref:MEDS domain-containing protein n=1 Tax=Pseudonocardia lacus TaxID=2835865 RepID=UPI001BDD8A25|nr:MEDS domain-containing protein [Pseudonocardia lacus]
MSPYGRSPSGGGGHRLLLHRSEPERVARLSGWVREGLALGEKVVYIEGGGFGDDVLAVLVTHGIEVDAAVAQGRLEVLAPEEFYRPGGQEALLDRVLAEGHTRLRISGEASTAYRVLSPAVHREVEDLVDRLCATRPVSALCQYTVGSLPGAALDSVVGMHPGGLTELSLDVGEADDGLVLRGAVDFTNVEVLRASMVAAMSAAGDAVVLRVDFADVEHLAASACRAIVRAWAPSRTPGPRLVLSQVQPVVARVMRLCGVDAAGIEIVERAR